MNLCRDAPSLSVAAEADSGSSNVATKEKEQSNMKKKMLVSLLLALCLLAATVTGFAQGIFFSEGGSNGNSEGGSTGSFTVDIPFATAAPEVCLDPICVFLPISWDDVAADMTAARSQISGQHTTPSGWTYTNNCREITSPTLISGVIEVQDDDFDMLKNVWLELGNICADDFDTMETVEGVDEESLKAYAFISDETYLRYEFIDSGSYRYIIYVAIKN